jgi:hypothetical protein
MDYSVQLSIPKKSVIKIAVVIIALILTTTFIVVFIFHNNFATNVEITNTRSDSSSYDSASGVDYFVSVSLLNHGINGNVTVHCEINGGNKYQENINQQKSINIFLRNNEAKDIEYFFDLGPPGWQDTSKINYKVWVTS